MPFNLTFVRLFQLVQLMGQLMKFNSKVHHCVSLCEFTLSCINISCIFGRFCLVQTGVEIMAIAFCLLELGQFSDGLGRILAHSSFGLGQNQHSGAETDFRALPSHLVSLVLGVRQSWVLSRGFTCLFLQLLMLSTVSSKNTVCSNPGLLATIMVSIYMIYTLFGC